MNCWIIDTYLCLLYLNACDLRTILLQFHYALCLNNQLSDLISNYLAQCWIKTCEFFRMRVEEEALKLFVDLILDHLRIVEHSEKILFSCDEISETIFIQLKNRKRKYVRKFYKKVKINSEKNKHFHKLKYSILVFSSIFFSLD